MDLIDVYEDVLDYTEDVRDSIDNLRRCFDELEEAIKGALIVNGDTVDLEKIIKFKNETQDEYNKIKQRAIPAIERDIEELEDDEDDD